MKNKEDYFNILRNIKKYPSSTQRELANKSGISLGKFNYCLKALTEKGLVKIQNFRDNKKKINYIYALTPKGIMEKTKLTVNFMNQKIKEYDELKLEVKNK